MRSVLVALSLLTSACAASAGVDPDATVPPTSSGTTSTVPVDDATRAAAVEVASRFYDAVLDGDGAAIAGLGIDPPATLQEDLDRWAQSIKLDGGSFIVIRTRFSDASAEVTVRLSLDLTEVGPWSYETSVTLVGGPDWSTVWSPSALHPSLEEGDQLRVDRSWLPRASILARDGTAIAGAEAVKVVGVVPARVEDIDLVTNELARLASIDPAVITEELANPAVQPDWFVPVGTIKTVVYAAVGEELEALPGVVLRDGSERLPFRDDFAQHLIGSVGPITAEQLDELGFPYGPTDVVGQTGLEERFEDQLAGLPRTVIVRINRFGRIMEELFVIESRAPEDLRTTIDVSVQTAVEQALRDVRDPAAVVVIQAATGEVRGIASRPLSRFDRAVLGTYPPGSTFKVITASGLLNDALEPDSAVECPPEVTVGGLTITNAGSLDLGEVTLTEAFAASCNTTFAAQAVEHLTPQRLSEIAESFGFNTEPALGIASAASTFPLPADDAEVGSAAIGQARVAVSPVHMASVAAAASTGDWRPPTVLALPDRRQGRSIGAGAAGLPDLMLAVVTDGTGTNAAVSGVAVRGKTGSAEFEEGSEATHAWFIGYWDDLAIAVLVEGGGGGGAVAAPIARRVIADLAG